MGASLPLRRIAAACSWSIVDYGGGRFLSLVAFAYVARVIGSAQLGIYSVCIAFAQTAAVFVESGTTTFGIREVAQNRGDEQRLLSSITYLRIVVALIVVGICAGVICRLPAWRQYRSPLLAACGYLLSYSLAQDWHYVGRRIFRVVALANMAKGGSLLAGCILLVKGPHDLMPAVILYSVTPLIATAIFTAHSLWRLNLNPFIPARLLDVKMCAQRGFAFAGISLGQALYTAAPVYVIAWMGTMEQTGIFSAAQRPVILAASGIVLPLSSVFLPFLAENYQSPGGLHDSQALFRHVIWIVTIPVAVLAIGYSPYVIHLLYGSHYLSTVNSFRIMSLIIVLLGLRPTFSHILIAGHRQNTLAVIAFAAALVTALMTGVLVRFGGATGAAWGTVLGEVAYTSLTVIFARRFFPARMIPADCWPVFIAAGVMILPMFLPAAPLLKIGLSLCLFTGVLCFYDQLVRSAWRGLVTRRSSVAFHPADVGKRG